MVSVYVFGLPFARLQDWAIWRFNSVKVTSPLTDELSEKLTFQLAVPTCDIGFNMHLEKSL